MAKPFKVKGACKTTARNVFKVKFSQPLSAVPQLRAYDNDQTYPQTGNLTTANYVIFTGSTGNGNKPMLHVLDTTRGGPGTSNWSAQSTIGQGVGTCMMKGDTSYLQFRYSTASVGVANCSLFWNALMKIPYDVNPTMTRLHDVAVRYQFTSTIPSVTFYANDEDAGGTDSTPVWGTIVPDSSGIRFGNSSSTATNILANIPLSGEEETETAWVTET